MKSADSIKARLRTLATQANKPYDYILTHYFIESVLLRIAKSRFAGDFVLKGGLLLHVLFDHHARATRDIDLLAQHVKNTPENMITIFREICSIEADDAVNYDLNSLTVENITPTAAYSGFRVKVICSLDRSRSTLQLDIGFGDAIVPYADKMIYPSMLGTEEIEILAYSKESVIAEKFQAMLSLAMANSRMKDFYDIAMFASQYDFEGQMLQNAILETLHRRSTILSPAPVVFSQEFSQDHDKKTQWNAFAGRTQVDETTFEDALEMICQFIQPVYMALMAEEKWMGSWDHRSKSWHNAEQKNAVILE